MNPFLVVCGFAIRRLFVGLGIMDKPPHGFLSVDVSKWWFGTQECALLFERDVSNENPGCLGYIGDFDLLPSYVGIIIRNHFKDPYLTTGAEILPKATHLGASHLGCLSEAQRELVRNFGHFSGGQMVGQSHEMRFCFNLSHFGWHLGHVSTQQAPPRVPFHQACWTEWKNKTLHYTRHCERREVRQFGWNWYPGIPPHGSMIMVQ